MSIRTMSRAVILCLFLCTIPAANGGVECKGENCHPQPTPASLVPATVVTPKRPATLVQPTVLTPTSPVTLSTASTHHPTPTNQTTHSPTNQTTHSPTNHTTHSPTNQTTHAPTNHTTHSPTNHTTHSPTNHTTHSPTNHTTHSPTNHTTHSPTNHTTHSALTTPVHPTTTPALQSGHYNVSVNKSVCVMADVKLQLRIRYQGAKKKMSWGLFRIEPKKTKTSGSCGKDFVNMTLTFPEGYLMFGFKKNSQTQRFYLSEVQSELMYMFPDTTVATRYSVHNTSLVMLQTDLGHSYRCSNQSVEANSTFFVDMVDQRIQAFNFAKNQQFGSAEFCFQDQKLPVVAIVVVVVLIVLIIVVVLAYLIGRRRTPAGYQSI